MRASSAAVAVVAVVTIGAIVVACAAGSPAGTHAPGASAAPAASPGQDSNAAATFAAASPAASATVMQVTLGSGPDSGSHSASSSTTTCTYGLAASGPDAVDSFGNQFNDDSSSGLSAVELIVPATKRAATRGTDAFLLSVTIGKPSKGHTYEINTLPASYGLGATKGSGRLAIEDDGAWGVVTAKGTSGDGTSIDAVIHCNQILDSNGQPRQ
jgi:hypothetical protein